MNRRIPSILKPGHGRSYWPPRLYCVTRRRVRFCDRGGIPYGKRRVNHPEPYHAGDQYHSDSDYGRLFYWGRSVCGLPNDFTFKFRCQEHAVDPHRLGDVLDVMLTQIFEALADFLFNLIEHPPGNTYASRVGYSFDPGGDVDPVPIDAVILVKNIPQIDADAKLHASMVGQFTVFGLQCALDFNGTVDGIQGTAKFCQNVVAGGIDHPTMVLSINSMMILR